jgi:hypothetical protein
MRLLTTLPSLLGLAVAASSISNAVRRPIHSPEIDQPSSEVSYDAGCDTKDNLVATRSDAESPEARKLRILCLGDSITVGYLSDHDDGDGNGYRLELRDKLQGMT